jgi:hypothetical protein
MEVRAARQGFEALMRDLNDCQDPEQRKAFLLRMKIVIDQVDELMKTVIDQVDEVVLREPATSALPRRLTRVVNVSIYVPIKSERGHPRVEGGRCTSERLRVAPKPAAGARRHERMELLVST